MAQLCAGKGRAHLYSTGDAGWVAVGASA